MEIAVHRGMVLSDCWSLVVVFVRQFPLFKKTAQIFFKIRFLEFFFKIQSWFLIFFPSKFIQIFFLIFLRGILTPSVKKLNILDRNKESERSVRLSSSADLRIDHQVVQSFVNQLDRWYRRVDIMSRQVYSMSEQASCQSQHPDTFGI